MLYRICLFVFFFSSADFSWASAAEPAVLFEEQPTVWRTLPEKHVTIHRELNERLVTVERSSHNRAAATLVLILEDSKTC